MNTKLEKYNQKRDFAKTPEPDDQSATFEWAKGQPFFVIQKHDASTLTLRFSDRGEWRAQILGSSQRTFN